MNQTEALNLLKQFSCIEPRLINSPEEKQQLQQAVIFISELADCQNFGICADNIASGIKALKSYLQATGYDEQINYTENVSTDEPVYLKFNTEKMSTMISSYSGKYRGVLITIFANYNQEIEGTYGHLPLDLFN